MFRRPPTRAATRAPTSAPTRAAIVPTTLAAILAATFALAAPLQASAQPDPGATQLGSLFVEASTDLQAQLCSQRVPATQAAWTAALADWKARHKAELQEMRTLSKQVSATLGQKGQEGLAVAFQSYAMTVPLHALASQRDPQAEQLCERFRSQLQDDKATARTFQDARSAVAAVMAMAEKGTK